MTLVGKTAPKENIVVTGARVLDPVTGIDAEVDVRVSRVLRGFPEKQSPE